MNPKRIYLSPPHMSGLEQEFVREAFESNFIAPLGPQVDAFEKEFSEYVGIRHCVALSSGTAAMHLALREILRGRRLEDQKIRGLDKIHNKDSSLVTDHSSLNRPLVIASTLTFVGSVSPAVFERCDITFVDCDRSSWNMDPVLLEEELERCGTAARLPVAVIPTDLYGQCCDLARIVEICDRFGVPVICDSAEALGARYLTQGRNTGKKIRRLENEKISNSTSILNPLPITHDPSPAAWRHAGAGAKAAIFSFNGNKIITTSGGGMLASDDREFIEQARFLSQQARDPFPHYEHTQIGYNYRMSNILAAIGRGQLRMIEERVSRKREIFDYYREKLGDLPGIEFMPETDYGRCTRWLTVITVDPEMFGTDREAVRLALEAENIEARPVWKPMHLQPVFKGSDERPVTGNQKLQSHINKKKSNPQNSKPKTRNPKPVAHYPCRVVGGAVSERLFEQGLCLPSGTAMTEGDFDRVIGVIKKIRNLED